MKSHLGMRRLPAVGGLLLLSAVAVTACGVSRDGTLHPSVNDCVAAIPSAAEALHHTGRLVSLRRVALPEVQRVLTRAGAPVLTRADAHPTGATPASARPSPSATVAAQGKELPRPCVLVYSGHFRSTDLPASVHTSGKAGTFALLVTTTRHPRVMRIALTDHNPLH